MKTARYRHKTASLTIEVAAVAHAFHWLSAKETSHKAKAVIVIGSMSFAAKSDSRNDSLGMAGATQIYQTFKEII